MKQHRFRVISTGAALLAIAAAALPAMAQAQTLCGTVSCSATQIAPDTLRQIAAAETARAHATMAPGTADRNRRLASMRDQWDQNIARPEDQEDYACLLSFGLGGQLEKMGFVGTRVLGKTQVWRKAGE